MLRYTKLRELDPEAWKGISLSRREELKKYVREKFRGFYAEVNGETIYLGRLVHGRGDDIYIVINKNRHSIANGSLPREAYRFVASKIKRHRHLKAKKP